MLGLGSNARFRRLLPRKGHQFRAFCLMIFGCLTTGMLAFVQDAEVQMDVQLQGKGEKENACF